MPGDKITFTGFNNYAQLFTSFEVFGKPLVITIIFVISSITLEFIIALLLALLISSRDIKGKNFFRTCLIIPMATTPVIVGLMGKYLFSDFGIINHYLGKLGIPPQPWLGSSTMALIVVIIVEVWQWTPFMILILEAGLNDIPQTAVEAADMDGAKPWQVVLFIKLPLLKRLIVLALMLRTMDCIRIFDMIWSLTGGGPVNATETVSIAAYRIAFRYFNIGLGTAYCFMILIITILISIFYVNILTREEQGAW
ncbi:MAG: sugar ABC transporter permease [Actinobacteria bacterium]|nr:sugar ABC transporter permease [Actinomycetota bacterium]